jgi:hypothetical protein
MSAALCALCGRPRFACRARGEAQLNFGDQLTGQRKRARVDLLPDMKEFGFGKLLEDYYRSHMHSAGGKNDQLVAFRRKSIPFLDDKPEPLDEKEPAFRRFFADLSVRLFEDAG